MGIIGFNGGDGVRIARAALPFPATADVVTILLYLNLARWLLA
jgi:hypothetical protein